MSAQKLVPILSLHHLSTGEKKTDLQAGKRSCCVEKSRRQYLKRAKNSPAGWFRIQHTHTDVFVTQKIHSSKGIVGLADSTHRRQFILRILFSLSLSLSSFQLAFMFWYAARSRRSFHFFFSRILFQAHGPRLEL